MSLVVGSRAAGLWGDRLIIGARVRVGWMVFGGGCSLLGWGWRVLAYQYSQLCEPSATATCPAMHVVQSLTPTAPAFSE